MFYMVVFRFQKPKQLKNLSEVVHIHTVPADANIRVVKSLTSEAEKKAL